ncbi:MAG: hypothetical protein EOO14_03595 [Chitinophagaceae bacterium]|nr:MAG: hypothetical protein EOO14_03595 [Chitinophagaceae bacterium]
MLELFKRSLLVVTTNKVCYRMKYLFVIFAMLLPAMGKSQVPRMMLPLGHGDAVLSVQFAPDGKKVLSSSVDHTVKIWNTATGVLLQDLKEHSSQITSARFSPDGRLVATTAFFDKQIKLWDVRTGKLLKDLPGHTDGVLSACFSPDGKRVVSASQDKTAKVWDVRTGMLLLNLKGHGSWVESVGFSADGRRIATASADGSAKIWDAANGALLNTLSGHSGGLVSAQFSPDSKRVLTASWDSSARIWDANSGSLVASLKGHRGAVLSAAFSPDGRVVVTASLDSTAKVWNAADGAYLFDCAGHTNWVSAAKFSSNGAKVITASKDGTVRVWDARNGAQLSSIEAHAGGVESVAFSADAVNVVTGGNDNIVRVWDVTRGTLLTELKGHTERVAFSGFSSDQKKIVTTGIPHSIRVWDAVNGVLLSTIKDTISYYTIAQFSPDAKKLVTASIDFSYNAKVWDVGSSRLLFLLPHDSEINDATFSPDGSEVVTASIDRTAKVWNASTGALLRTLRVHTGRVSRVRYSVTGKMIATGGSDSVVVLWDATTGAVLRKMQGHQGGISILQFSPDDQFLATASSDGSLKIWEVEGGKLRLDIRAHAVSVASIHYSADGSRLITTSYDSSVKVWDATTGALLKKQRFDGPVLAVDYDLNQVITGHNYELSLYALSSGKKQLSFLAIDSTDWVCLSGEGLFDASPGAMEKMYWLKGDEVISFDQLKDRYWQPGLWQKIMKGEPLRSVAGMSQLQLQPELKLGKVENNILPIVLKKREGGYGKVSVLVNGKEVAQDARPRGFDTARSVQQILFNLKQFLVPGEKNTIEVNTWSKDGFVVSRGVKTTVEAQGVPGSAARPAFYAIICGTGAFANPNLSLKYSVPDAQAIAKAIEIGASNLFGKDSVLVQLLTHPGSKPTTKENIRTAFATVKAKAKPQDVVLVYLSGHGITYGGENGDFYYLTSEASASSAESFSDPALRAQQAISTSEFTSWLNSIRALKQVMILDACGSGRAVDNLIAKRDIDPSQIKAIDRMKDRTGLYVISGCAADAVSYEASRYGQGLLTYALLQALKGARLKENRFVDVNMLLEYARDEVPRMAEGIGGIQKPQLLLPKSGSFDLGIIKEEDRQRIPLASIKPVFVRATLFEESKKRDVLRLSSAVNDKLNELSGVGAGSKIVFVDTDDYPDACSISGGYSVREGKIYFIGSILCGQKERPLKFESITSADLIRMIVDEALKE